MTDDRVARLELRLERERRARAEAEAIAEQGMRALWEANAALDRLVAERTAEAARALDHAAAASEATTALLSHLGHELQTPLHAIAGLLELVDTSRLTREDRNRVAGVRAASGRLTVWLAALLYLARVEALPLRPERRRTLDVSDALAGRWRRAFALRGVLLVAETAGDDRVIEAPWTAVEHVADVLLDAAPAEGSASVVTLRLVARTGDVTLELHGLAPEGERFGAALGERLLRAVGGELEVKDDLVRALVPRAPVS